MAGRQRKRGAQSTKSGKQRATKTYQPLQHQASNSQRGGRSARYIPREETSRTFWSPGLDDKTKYMMRLNGLAVGFVWKEAADKTVYLSGTKVVRSRPLTAKKPAVRVYPEDMLQRFVFKVAPEPDALSKRKSSTLNKKAKNTNAKRPASDKISNNHSKKMCMEDTLTSIKTEPVFTHVETETERPNQSAHKSFRPTEMSKPLTKMRYSVYRYFILRCKSMYHQYHSYARANRKFPKVPAVPFTNPIMDVLRRSVTVDTLRLTRSLSSYLSRLRARLKVCSQNRMDTSQQLLDMMGGLNDINGEDSQDAVSFKDRAFSPYVPVASTSSGRSSLLLKSSSIEQSEGSGAKKKTLKVKRERRKLQQEQETWGYYELDEEVSRQHNQIRQRRYQYLKAAKQSKLHQEDQPSTSTSIPGPQIISIESLSGDTDLQALSWEVPLDKDNQTTSNFFLKHNT